MTSCKITRIGLRIATRYYANRMSCIQINIYIHLVKDNYT